MSNHVNSQPIEVITLDDLARGLEAPRFWIARGHGQH